MLTAEGLGSNILIMAEQHHSQTVSAPNRNAQPLVSQISGELHQGQGQPFQHPTFNALNWAFGPFVPQAEVVNGPPQGQDHSQTFTVELDEVVTLTCENSPPPDPPAYEPPEVSLTLFLHQKVRPFQLRFFKWLLGRL